MALFTRSAQVVAYACAQCGNVYREQGEADECCTCADCGLKYPSPKGFGYGHTCGHCSYGRNLREARARVRREEGILAGSKKHLERLLTEKKPAKGSAA